MLRNVTEKILRKSYKFPCFYGAIYGTLRNMRPQFAGLIFLLYLCSRVRQMVLTDVARRHKTHHCLRSPKNNDARSFSGMKNTRMTCGSNKQNK